MDASLHIQNDLITSQVENYWGKARELVGGAALRGGAVLGRRVADRQTDGRARRRRAYLQSAEQSGFFIPFAIALVTGSVRRPILLHRSAAPRHRDGYEAAFENRCCSSPSKEDIFLATEAHLHRIHMIDEFQMFGLA